jgi:hypothetical protein
MRCRTTSLLQAAVIADDIRRSASHAARWNERLADYLQASASASAFGRGLTERGYRLQYLVDIGYDDLTRPAELYPFLVRRGLSMSAPR